jgi:hypothetical protein
MTGDTKMLRAGEEEKKKKLMVTKMMMKKVDNNGGGVDKRKIRKQDRDQIKVEK